MTLTGGNSGHRNCVVLRQATLMIEVKLVGEQILFSALKRSTQADKHLGDVVPELF